jgi:hypothetical protein
MNDFSSNKIKSLNQNKKQFKTKISQISKEESLLDEEINKFKTKHILKNIKNIKKKI